MKSATLFVLSIFIILISCSCAKKHDSNEKVLNVIVPSDIKGFDPMMASDLGSASQIAKIYEGLLTYHWLKKPYELIPNLAESMPEISKDGLTYTFKLRKGVMFQDDKAFPEGKGREVTAEDFVYSFKRHADTKNQSTGWWLFDGKIKGLNEWREKYSKLEVTDYSEEIEGLVAIDRYTLQFKLSKVFPQFLYSLAMPFSFVVAKEVVDFYGREFINHPVGTGPYILPSFNQGKKLVYTKNPNYREKFYPNEASEEFKHMLKHSGKKVPFIDKIIVEVMVEAQPAWLKFNKGEIDYLNIPKDNFASTIKGDSLSKEMTDKGVSLSISPSLDVYFYGFNFDHEIFRNINLRRAMSLAFDQSVLNSLFYNNTGFIAESVTPPGIAGNDSSFKNKWKGPNLKLAKEYLAKAGYPNGEGLPEITLETFSSTTARQKGELFQKQMAEIGIKIKVVTNLNPELQAKIKNRSTMMIDYGWIGDYPDTENFLQIFYGPNSSPGANSSNYNNQEFNKRYEVVSKMQDSPERTKIYESLTQFLSDEVVAIFTVHTQNYMLQQGWVENYHTSDFIFDYHQYLDIDVDKKKQLKQ